MNYLEQLRARKSQKSQTTETAKTDRSPEKGVFVSFDSTHKDTFPKKNKAEMPQSEESEKCTGLAPTKPTKAGIGGGSEKPEKAPRYAPPKLTKVLPSITVFEERATILEYDAGLDRETANLAAARELGFTNLAALLRCAPCRLARCNHCREAPGCTGHGHKSHAGRSHIGLPRGFAGLP